jgi:glycosyltransferase involved in cell wall biosynthesis
LAPSPVRVVFVTTVFEDVDTGPGTYARYLWRAFRDDPELEFHLVAPVVAEQHPRLHASGPGSGSLDLYRRVQATALELARTGDTSTILHGNSTHGMGRCVDYPGPLLVQVNDYDVAHFPRRARRILREQGLRRLAGLAWRYGHEERVLRHATLALCNSQYTASVVARAYGLAPDRLQVVYKAVNTEAFARPHALPADPLPDRPRGTRLVYVGADARRKGLDVLLAAVARLAPDVPGLVLSVIGPERDEPWVNGLIVEHGLQATVSLEGRLPREQVAAHLWHSDVFVLPSRREAFGVAVLEAMAAGLPVVATEVGGIPEIVQFGRDGVLVPPEDSAALAAALGLVLSDPARREALATEGVRRARDFSVDTMIRMLRETYFTLARKAQGA